MSWYRNTQCSPSNLFVVFRLTQSLRTKQLVSSPAKDSLAMWDQDHLLECHWHLTLCSTSPSSKAGHCSVPSGNRSHSSFLGKGPSPRRTRYGTGQPLCAFRKLQVMRKTKPSRQKFPGRLPGTAMASDSQRILEELLTTKQGGIHVSLNGPVDPLLHPACHQTFHIKHTGIAILVI